MALLLSLSLLLAAGHSHDRFQVEDGDCTVCHLQQAKWLPEVDTPKLAPDNASEALGIAAFERLVLDRSHLLEPLRGPPTLA